MLKFNPFTQTFDYTLSSSEIQAISNALYLKLDQTTPQTVINGAPIFDAGLRCNGAIILKSGQKLIFDGT